MPAEVEVKNVVAVGGIPPAEQTPVEVPGITTGAAYADKDQIGSLFSFDRVSRNDVFSGILQGGNYYDLDDEGLQVDLWLFYGTVTLAADNAAFALSDGDLAKVVAVLSFTAFSDAANGQFSQVTGLAKPFRTRGGTRLWAAAQARGALNIAAGNLPRFSLDVLPD